MKIKSLFESKFIKVFDLQYREGRHYYNATRRDEEDLVAAKSTEEFKKMLPDAVSCVVIWNPSDDDEKSGHEPCLLMNREFRYPTGQYLLSVPAGLIEPEDCTGDNDNTVPLIKTAMRELHEETGLKVTEKDTVSVINPCLFSTPGMTDEGNALVYISINRDEMPKMNHDGAEGSEVFEGFRLVSKEDAEEYLCKGRDEHGMYYPLFTWAALMFFMGV